MQCAVRCDGLALEFASQELKSKRSVCLDAVTENGRALQHAPDHLKDDEEVSPKNIAIL